MELSIDVQEEMLQCRRDRGGAVGICVQPAQRVQGAGPARREPLAGVVLGDHDARCPPSTHATPALIAVLTGRFRLFHLALKSEAPVHEAIIVLQEERGRWGAL